MPKKPRRPVYLQGHFYHLYNRGISMACIFREVENYYFVLRRIKKYRRELNLSLIAYCLLPNHYHLLVHQAIIPLLQTVWADETLHKGSISSILARKYLSLNSVVKSETFFRFSNVYISTLAKGSFSTPCRPVSRAKLTTSSRDRIPAAANKPTADRAKIAP
jgi:hypothetical protein